MSTEDLLHIPLDELVLFVNQSRQVFDEGELRNLSEDIKANGLLQPGVAWFDAGRGKYVLICGERRLRACKLAGLPTMAVKVIHGNLTPGEMLAINLSENLQRSSLNPVERAKSFQRLAQLEDITSKQVAARMHVSDATVSRDLALLDLPTPLLDAVCNGTLAVSVAYELSRITDPTAQLELAEQVVAKKMSRQQVAEKVRDQVGKRKTTPKGGRISARLAGGVFITVVAAAEKSLTIADVRLAADHLRKEAKKLEDGERHVAALADAV